MTSQTETGIEIDKRRGCVGTTIRTASGVYFDLVNPTPEMVNITDIARALSQICRFGGQCRKFYSVAEHCLVCLGVARMDGLDARACRSVLLHDAAEAYIGDMVKPLKVLIPAFSDIEKTIEAVIAEKYDCDFHDRRISEIDFSVLIAERRKLFSFDQVYWAGQELARDLSENVWIEGESPNAAQARFMEQGRFLGVET